MDPDLQLKVNTVEILQCVGICIYNDHACIHLAKRLPRKRKLQFFAKKNIKMITKTSSLYDFTQTIKLQQPSKGLFDQ